MKKPICIAAIGIIDDDETFSTKKCDKPATHIGITCKFHKYFCSLTDDQQNQILQWPNCDNPDEVIFCKKCRHFVFDELDVPDGNIVSKCSNCKKVAQNNSNKKQLEKDAIKCKWYDRNGDPCKDYYIDGSSYCDSHSYVSEYTEEQINSGSCGSCPSCHMWVYQGETNLCKKCLDRNKDNRQKRKKVRQDCIEPGCDKTATDDQYCFSHYLINWKLAQEIDGDKKVCSAYKRGCRTVLDINFKYNKCDDCREKERAKDQRMRDKAKNS